jgi:hypothetical protein
MLTVKDLSKSSAKWSERASGAATEFAENAAAAQDLWGRATQAAEANYRAGISQANIGTRFARGVARALAKGKFANKITSVGGSRYSAGVQGAQADWADGFGPYHSALQALALPARRPRGDAANIQRVAAVASTLHAKRLAQLGSGG